jgi:hypothetical protein
LRDEQTAGGGDEIAAGGDGEEGAGEFGVHEFYIGYSDSKYKK